MKNLQCLTLALFLWGCGGGPATEQQAAAETGKGAEEAPAADNALTEAERVEGWVLLFDGKSAQGWRGYNQDSLPANWKVEKGTLMTTGAGEGSRGDIVYGERPFDNFDLYLEWKIEEAGNSGIFYHAQEGEQYQAIYENAPEYQLLDDIGFPQELLPDQYTGAIFGLYVPADKKPLKAAGKWNSSRIRFTPQQVTHWLNGKEVLRFEPWSDDWQMRKEISKWKNYPDYGVAKSGLVGLQDHGSQVWFKNIKIRPL
ncbi:MAG: DUF1080 domain-containing protein [Bacteroidetes bacterium]|nr:DUF1080 domain-containing protein [Bacteroidota bacterium]